LLIWWW